MAEFASDFIIAAIRYGPSYSREYLKIKSLWYMGNTIFDNHVALFIRTTIRTAVTNSVIKILRFRDTESKYNTPRLFTTLLYY